MWRYSPNDPMTDSRWPFLTQRVRDFLQRHGARSLPALLADNSALDFRIVGRTLLHAAAVGVAAGVAGAILFGGLELFQYVLLERLAGYVPLRADGETITAGVETHPFRPWLLVFLPALGGLACGCLSHLAPEIAGGGGDAMIDAFHHRGGRIRPRVIGLKALASMFTLGSGGAGGREGPTMQIGGALGSLVAKLLRVSARERRILLVAGVAAGISAVFRTPLGAALLAVEVLYKDGFESDALIPSVLASVVSYSVIITIFGPSTLFARVPRFPFHPEQLLLYGLLALLIAALSAGFLTIFRRVRTVFQASRVPPVARPALGGLLLGMFAVPLLMVLGQHIHQPGQGLGLLGGGYGAVQMAISGTDWLPEGWTAVAILAALAVAKVFAASLTIGSGGSAGDFAPSLAIGGLFGGAFGRAAQLLLHDPSIQPGAFALVGMGTFYGGIAHVPLAALVLVCELAGNYDLLVPLMLTQGIAFVALRKRALYEAQAATLRESPVHRDTLILSVLQTLRVSDVVEGKAPPVCFAPGTPLPQMLEQTSRASDQELFPVTSAEGRLIGLITSATLRVAIAERADSAWVLAADLMHPAVSVQRSDDLRTTGERMLSAGLRELPVVSKEGHVVGLVTESALAGVYLRGAARAEGEAASPRKV
jgi:chloride channel protein, CIC family